MGRMSIMWPT